MKTQQSNRTLMNPIAQKSKAAALGFATLFLISPLAWTDGNMSDYTATPPTITALGAGDKPNVLVILDNSNSMDEAPSGAAVGSANPGSKSEIARNAVESMVTTFTNKIRMGLMAYQQDSIAARQLHDAQYDGSYDPTNYDPSSTAPRDSLTKKYRVPNTSSPGDYIHYNVSLPFYSSSNQGSGFCYSNTADFDNGSETYPGGPWDSYRCFREKTGPSDVVPTNGGEENTAGYDDLFGTFSFLPTDSDLAQGILDFGSFLTWQHVGPTWFSNTSPGRGYLHVPIDDLDAGQAGLLNAKLATSQFASATDTPLRNAGLTPIEGTLLTAKDYFAGVSLDADEGGATVAPPSNVCGDKDYVVLVTDGLPSTDEDGNAVTDTATAIADAASAAADLLASGVRTYVVGFALPEGVSPTVLDDIASAGGTGTAYSASDSATLNSALITIFNNILNRTSAASTASVVSNSSTGVGAFYQALYTPEVELINPDTNVSSKVSWVGELHSLFVDSYGYLREDGDGDAVLDNYSTDLIVGLEYNEILGVTQVVRYDSSSATAPTSLTARAPASLDTLQPIWSVRDSLSNYVNLTTQRSFATPASPGNALLGDRYVFTWIDNDGDGTAGAVDASEVIDFTSTAIDSSNFRYFGVASEADADTVVNYIRGEEIAGTRSRTIDFDQDGTDEVWRLGDIVHSSPAVVGAPRERYDALYGDVSYSAFKAQYKDRRQMIYVGANDGLLHAFNGGFWDETNKAFLTTSGALAQYALGEEVWAYAPQNLLPHLQWLKDSNYSHVYFMDGPPLVFDARIFTPDADHPGGWGTVLVIGMRLGGGTFSLDTDGDATNDTQTRSAYVIMDVTNPEADPKGRLMAEITDANLGFTTSKPAVVKMSVPGVGGDWATASSDWFLVFGSGPNVLSDVTSTQNAGLYVLNLETMSFEAGFAPLDLAEGTSFVGDVSTIDWDLDFVDDGAYFGTVGGTPASPTGKLKRLRLDVASAPNNIVTSASVTDLLTPAQPFMSAPSFDVDNAGRRWVFAGSGRLFAADDNTSSTQQSFYGLKEPIDAVTRLQTWGTVTTASLQDVSGIRVFDDGTITPSPTTVGGTSVTNYTELRGAMAAKPGWKRNFTGAERNITKSVNFRTLVLFTSYTPSADACLPEGDSKLYALNSQTGTAMPHGALGFDSGVTNGTAALSLESVDIGQGTAGEIQVFQGDGIGGSKARLITGMGTGAVSSNIVETEPVESGRRSWREIDLN